LLLYGSILSKKTLKLNIKIYFVSS